MLATCLLERRVPPRYREGEIDAPLRALVPLRNPVAESDLRDCGTIEALRTWLQRFSLTLGFYGGRYVHLGHGASTGRGSPMRFLSTSPRDASPDIETWLDRDPAVAEVRGGFAPFAFSTRLDKDVTSAQRVWLDAERARGVRAGVVVPVQDHAAGPAYVSLFGIDDSNVARLVAQQAAELAFTGAQFHDRAKALLPLTANGRGSGELTQREVQCLQLAARGWTVPASATELAITARTVEFHLANAAMKLGAINKIHAVALATSERLILV
jgi:LuxR family transcriptional activator of conjugal transfer of Ti plasmids